MSSSETADNVVLSSSDYEKLLSPNDISVCQPEAFNGNREKTSQFVTQLRLYFFAKPAFFNSERAKILYSISLLEGLAFKWI